jgi:hypothetical protein
MSSTKATRSVADLAQRTTRVYEEARQILAEGEIDRLSEQSIQQLLTAAVKLYVAKREAGSTFPPFVDETVTATEVSVTATSMVKAVDMQIFELSLWSGFGTI